MSECGKKRARKSKLVPRVLVDVDDGDEELLHLLKAKKIKPEKSLNRNTKPDTEEQQDNVNEIQKSVPSHYQLEVAICDDDDWEYPEELEACGEGNSHDDYAININGEEPINNLDEMKIEVEECDLAKVKLEISTHSEEDYRIVDQSPDLNQHNDKEDVNTVQKCNEAGILRHVLCHQTKIKTRSLLKPFALETLIGPVSGAKHSVLIEHNYGKNPESADATQLKDTNASSLYYRSKIIQSTPELLAEFNGYKLETRPADEKRVLITNFKSEVALLAHGLKNQPPNAKIDESKNKSNFNGFWSHKRGIHYAKMFRVMEKFKFNFALIKKKSCYICKLCCSSWGNDLLEFHNHLYSHKHVLDIKCVGSKDVFYVVSDEKTSKSEPSLDTGYTSHSYTNNISLANFYDTIDFGIVLEYMRLNDPSIKIICYKCYGCRISWEHYADFKHHLNQKTHRREPKFGTEFVNRTKIRVYACWLLTEDLKISPLPLLLNSSRQRVIIFKCLLCKLKFDSQEQLEEHSKTLVQCICGFLGPCDEVTVHKGSCLEHLSSCYPKICMCGGIYETRDQLKAHEGTCNEKIYASYQCIVCTYYSPTAKTLLEHQKQEHTVRSDEITTVTLLKCKKCKVIHAAPPIWHFCRSKQDTIKCKFCEGQFQSTYFLELHHTVFGGVKKCSVEGCSDMLLSGCLQELHEIEMHDNSRIAVMECTTCLSLWLNKELGLKHVRTSHSSQTRCNPVFPLRKLILKKTMVVVKNGQIEYTQERPAVLRTYGKIKPKKKSTEQLNDAQSTPTDTKELPVKNETNNSVDSFTKVPEITAETVSMTDTVTKVKEEFTENDTKTVKEEPLDIVENDITPTDIQISYIELKEYIEANQLSENVGEESANNTAEDKEIKKEIDEKNEELSKIFRVSKHLDWQIKPEDEIKTEIKDEPFSEDEVELLLFQEYLNESDEDKDISYVPSTSQEPITIDEFIENNSEISLDNNSETSCLEPIILIDEGNRGKIHTCKKCNFRAPFKTYAEHVETCGMAVTAKEERRDGKFLTSQYKPSYLEQTMTIRCSKCASEYTDMREYVVHLSQHGPNKVCPCCRQAFSYKHLVQHILATIKRLYVFGYTINASADSLKISSCIQCKTIVANKDFFVHWETRHMASTNKKVNTQVEYRDDVVKNEFTLPRKVLEDTLDMLVTGDTRASRVCHVCKKYFARIHEYKRHLIEHLVPDVLSKKQKYKCLRCQICGDAYDRVEHYKQHMRDHAKLPLYQCQICNKCFSDSSNFAKHKKVHNLKVMVCDNCGRKFQCRKMLERHMRVHVNEVPYKCEQCPVAYSFRSSLKRHVKLMHTVKAARFLCQICKAQFPTIKAKWEHEWEQHKERSSDADCPICFRQFRKFTDVKAHARVEHNVKLRGRRTEVTKQLKKLRKFCVPSDTVEQMLHWQPLRKTKKARRLASSQDADIGVRVA